MLRSSFLEGREPAPLRILAFRRRFIRFALLSPAAPRSQPGADDALFAWVAGTRSFLNAAAPGPSPKMAIFDLDPVSLIHGVFFAQKQWPSQPKIARAITCFIDALDVRPAVSGGVKTDSVNPSNDEGRGAKEGYGMVPHQRVEYTARDITASVVVDHGQIRSYGLGEKAEAVLNALVDFELASLFRQDGLRLRTACHLVVDQDCEDLAKIPTLDEATAKLRQAIDQHGDFAPTSELKWTGGGK